MKRLLILVAAFLTVLAAETALFAELNIAGELNLRYRYNTQYGSVDAQKAKQGLEFYEIELFIDNDINDYASIFIEYPISHSNYLNPGSVWADFHLPGMQAAAGGIGIMVGNFSPLFSYLSYDDNQSWIIFGGGRTTTNTPLLRGSKIDEQTFRDRQIGLAFSVNYGPVILQQHFYNGSGAIQFSGGADNDWNIDFSGRLIYQFENIFLAGLGYLNSPKTMYATANTPGTRWGGAGAKHVRDNKAFTVFLKYPNVLQATLPDFSLGGSPFVIYGEYVWGEAYGNGSVAGFEMNQKYEGAYVEANVKLPLDNLVFVTRYDYWAPDRTDSAKTLHAVTPAVRWMPMDNVFLSLSYEYYTGKSKASGRDDDRISTELNVWY